MNKVNQIISIQCTNFFQCFLVHCEKSVCIRSYSGPHFPRISCIWTEYGEIRPEVLHWFKWVNILFSWLQIECYGLVIPVILLNAVNKNVNIFNNVTDIFVSRSLFPQKISIIDVWPGPKHTTGVSVRDLHHISLLILSELTSVTPKLSENLLLSDDFRGGGD